jgi:DNA invertase Pin-like site-specific DNA recombinase
MVYGYARISTPKQNIARQVRNIRKEFPEAHIVEETYTGTKFQGRKELEKLLKALKQGDMVVFDSVSRMSRTADEGFALYKELFDKEIELRFLKEPHINTGVYRQALESQIQLSLSSEDAATKELMQAIVEALNRYSFSLAEKQIRLAFEQSEKEVSDLRQRTKEGLVTARLNGRQIGLCQGTKLVTKKSAMAKQIILKHSRDFNGTLDDSACRKLTGVSRGTYYKYKRELKGMTGES